MATFTLQEVSRARDSNQSIMDRVEEFNKAQHLGLHKEIDISKSPDGFCYWFLDDIPDEITEYAATKYNQCQNPECHKLLDYLYIYVMEKMKDAGLLSRDEPLVCCYCSL